MNTPPNEVPSPREVMRRRRPHLFSDTKAVQSVGPNARQLLAFALDSIAENSQEHDFERFCTKLSECAIAGNIRPQTGPTGGGDSKSDSTTYAVDQQLALRWFSAVPRQAPQERWAFAYSCMQDWAKKVHSDVDGIMSISPTPSRIYFISSQPTRDKRRQEIESELQQAHGVAIHILDRTWICDQIESHGWWNLSNYLKCDVGSHVNQRLGPNDASRTAELQALESELRAEQTLGRGAYDLSCDYVSAALLSRGLERPLAATDGFFARARELAKECESARQEVWVCYNHAWTKFWWHEDFEAFLSFADFVFDQLPNANSADEIERAGNLFSLLVGLLDNQAYAKRAREIYSRAGIALDQRMEVLALDESRPTTAGAVRLLRAFRRLQDAVLAHDAGARDDALGLLAAEYDAAAAIGTIELGHYVDVLLVFGEVAEDSTVYDTVLDQIVAKHAGRVAGQERASGLLTRASQFLDSGEFVRAIATASVARMLLNADAPRDRRFAAMILAVAYDRLDQVWASRAEWLLLLHETVNCLPAGTKLSHVALRPALQLCLAELRLGRPTCFLAVYELLELIASNVSVSSCERAEIDMLDVFAGISYARAPISQIRALALLDSTLERLELVFCRACLHFAAGDVPSATAIMGLQGKDPESFFRKCAEQPASEDLPTNLVLHDAEPTRMQILVRGATMTVNCSGDFSSLLFSESLLATIQAFFSITTFKDLAFYESKIAVSVTAGEGTAISVTRDSGDIAVQLPKTGLDWSKHDGDTAPRAACHEVLVNILAHYAMFNDCERTLRVLAESGAFARTAPSETTPVILRNLGLLNYYMLDQWPKSDSLKVVREESAFGSTEQKRRQLHANEMVADLINLETWDGVGWRAVAYGLGPDGLDVGLVFDDAVKGKALVEELALRATRAMLPERAIGLTFFADWKRRKYVIQIGPNIDAYLPKDRPADTKLRTVAAASRRMMFDISQTTAQVLKFLAEASSKPIMLCAAAMHNGELAALGRPIPIHSCQVIDAEHVRPDDKFGQMFIDFISRNA